VARRKALQWDGPVYVLVGLGTFSSGADLAAALQDYGIATIVGDETGGLASSFGDPHRAQLPNTELQLNVSYKYFVRPSGVEGMRGVIPELPARSAPAATLEQDSAIVRVLEALRDGRSG
jgi:C-terminal processing protease CtpA/Prc